MAGRLHAVVTVTLGVIMVAPLVAAGGSVSDSETERDPYCELERHGAARDHAPGSPLPLGANGGPARVTACEGEHWDGQDPVAGDAHHEGLCTGAGEGAVALMQCPEPGAHAELDPVAPVGARASQTASPEGAAAAYSAVRASGAGVLATFLMACADGAPEPGHAAGPDRCQGDAHVVVGAYFHDQTPWGSNLVWRLLFAHWITPPPVGDADCTHEEYEQSRQSLAGGGEPTCIRDNTAVTVEVLL